MPLKAPRTVMTVRSATQRIVVSVLPATMPVSMARPTIHGPRVCGTIQMSATKRPATKSTPFCRTIHQRKALGVRVSGCSAARSV
jgi:hypothetical protein